MKSPSRMSYAYQLSAEIKLIHNLLQIQAEEGGGLDSSGSG
jgi:hypothetical protein